MVRQNFRVNPEEKLYESFTDFSGGLNSETSNENLKENEYPVLKNVDLSSRGSARIRPGRVSIGGVVGNGQGLLMYYRKNQNVPDRIAAISGKLYLNKDDKTMTEIPITDGGAAFTFQSTLPIEAVQHGEILYIATGTKLVELEHNGTDFVAKTVTPYSPTVMEAIYIGTNGLADNPDAYVQDGEGTLEVVGIKPQSRTGTVHQKMSMTAYINKPSTMTSTIDYKWEHKKASSSSWTLGKDWTADAKSYDFKVEEAGDWDIRVTIRESATTTPTPQYALTNFVVNQVEDKLNTSLPVDRIQTCRKIMLHYGRILLSNDDTNSFQMYISDLENPRYFPVTNTINFDTGKREGVNSVVRYRGMLVVFTKTTVQTLIGKSPEDYSRHIIHDGIGCIADRSAQVVGNNIVFLSHEGIHILKPNQFVLEVMNVSRIDYPIKSQISPSTKACAITHDSQYWICFPEEKKVYRLYYENNNWVVDESDKLNIVEFVGYGEEIYNLASDGNLYRHNPDIYTDDGVKYKMVAETKALDFSAKFNFKRIKRLYVLAGHFSTHNVGISATIYADSAIVLNPTSGEAVINSDGSVSWVETTAPNLNFYTGTSFGSWILGESAFGSVDVSVQEARLRGKCRRIKIRYEYEGGNEAEIFGFAVEFKLKNP